MPALFGQHFGQRLDDRVGRGIVKFTLPQSEVGRHLLLASPSEVVDHHGHVGVFGYLVVLRRRADAEGQLLQRCRFGHSAQQIVETLGVAVDDDVGAGGTGSVDGYFTQPLIDFLGQTGQGVARLADEYQSDEVVFPVSDGAQSLADAGTDDESRAEAVAVVFRSDRRARFQWTIGPNVDAKQDRGDSGKRDESLGHGKTPYLARGYEEGSMRAV
jgi:hypothetical protein